MVEYKNALDKSVEYFNGDNLAAEVFVGKYALKSNGVLLEETPRDLHKRLAGELARIESKYPNALTEEEIFNFLDKFKFGVAQGSPMAGIGNKSQIMSISNCFTVAPPQDSYSGILLTDQEEAQIMKRRGGVGFDISSLRPRGEKTANAAGTTDGIGVFMERFSNTTREVAQNGRRGALMLTISVHHPEIETFINIKKNLKKVTGANISVRLSDEFLKAAEENKEFELRWPVDSKTPKITKMVSAKNIWDQIVDSAWQSAEPGLLFWDTVQRETPTECYEEFKSTSTNPCSEIVLSNYDSCRLFLLNVFGYVKDSFIESSCFDWDLFSKHVQIAQRIMDDIVDLELESIDKILEKIQSDPEPQEVKAIEYNLWLKIREACVNGRRTGLGITGLGDVIAALGMKYGDDKSIEFTELLYKNLALNSYRSTVTMAKERGAFPAFDYNKEKEHPFLNRIFDLDQDLRNDWKKFGRRNIALTTTAPAGSVSLLTQTTSGIEPVFLVEYKRRKRISEQDKESKVDFTDDMGDRWQEYKVFHHGYKTWMEKNNKTENDFEESPYYKATSNDVDWSRSVALQGAAQKWVCHAISKTCNLPNEATKELVGQIYLEAWKAGCKGFTVYRDGCRAGVLVADTTKKSDHKFTENHAPKRPKELDCEIYHFTAKSEKWNAFVGLYEGRPYEIFAGRANFVNIPRSKKQGKIVKNGKFNLLIGDGEDQIVVNDLSTVFENSTESAFTRTISLALRHGTPIQYVVEQIEKGASRDNDMSSLAKGLMRVLKNYIKDGTKASMKVCEQCKESSGLIYQEGCLTCKSCGWSKCN